MAAIKLDRLRDRTPVKLAITIAPELHLTLQEYASAYERTYGIVEPLTELIPAILQAFLESDRAFLRSRSSGR